MKVEVDYGLCEGYAMCMGIIPEVFDLGDDDVLHILQPEIEDADLPFVQDALRQCPRQALRLTNGVRHDG